MVQPRAVQAFFRFPIVRWARKKYDRVYKKTVRFDRKTGYLSAGIPMFTVIAVTTSVGTMMMDKQFELRDLRHRSVSMRELSLQEEHDRLADFLRDTDAAENLDNSVPVPTRRELEPRI
eukprot:GDKH01016331.1.p1 GENE.GDKH01016331.1~~GDKH01016331.1.p1  ORF type:complete len:119 (+),score=9.81 GDKH01016331.1:202-558(+)